MQLICEITWTCPCRCPFCLVPKRDVLLPLPAYRRCLELFKSYFEGEELATVLSGGEPSTISFLKWYVEVARKLDYTVTIVTNAWNPKTVLEAEPDLVEVSIDYFGEKHDRARGVKGLYSRAMILVEKAVARGIHAVVRSTATKDNIEDILLLREHLNSRGLDIVPIIVMPVRGAPHLKPTQQQMQMLVKKRGILVSDNCPAGIKSFTVTPTREVLACIFYRKKLGTLHRFTEQELEKIVEEGKKLPRFPCEKQA